jgi:hypothetical protein
MITIKGKEYKVELNTMFMQPHLMINGYTMDVGIWKDTPKAEQDILLELAADCYEYHKANNSLKDSLGHLHQLEKK